METFVIQKVRAMETFVVQIWNQVEPKTEHSGDELRGFVEHVGSRRRESFRDECELLSFLHAEQRHPQQEVEQ
jgi:hypothetical protein